MINFRNKFLLIGIVILFALYGCKENSDNVPNVYELFLEFRGNDGTNLLNDFNVNTLKSDFVIKTDNGESLKGDYSIIESNDKKILKIHTSTQPDNKVNAITYTLTNEELTGNAGQYVLDTKWSFSNNNHVLIELSVNGNKLNPTNTNYFSYYILPERD
jgi:hypothetical protein